MSGDESVQVSALDEVAKPGPGVRQLAGFEQLDSNGALMQMQDARHLGESQEFVLIVIVPVRIRAHEDPFLHCDSPSRNLVYREDRR